MTTLPKINLGQTGVEVTRFGLGGEGILRTVGQESEAKRLIQRALELGVTYFESARAYAGGRESIRVGESTDPQPGLVDGKALFG
jgi:aryl-alcohol dehydrogenase-like predicted oxidoreductase